MARLPRELSEPNDNAHDIANTLAGIIRAAREVAAKGELKEKKIFHFKVN